jgi:glucose-1-phosphate cytidylyltransferase
MKYYAHFGFTDFVLCLGYKAEVIKQFFLTYNEAMANDFVLTNGGADVHLLKTDIHDWNITFVDTGLKSNLGMRLMLVKHLLEKEEMFLANYSDGLTDLPLDTMVRDFSATDKVATFLCATPSQTFHVVSLDEQKNVQSITSVRDSNIIVNAGYFVLRQSIFDYMNFGEELVLQPFQRLIKEKKLLAYNHGGFWAMDTFKEQQELTDLYTAGNAPWEVWKRNDPAEVMAASERAKTP